MAALLRQRTESLPVAVTAVEFGLPGALSLAARQSGAREALCAFWPQPRSGPLPARCLPLAVNHRLSAAPVPGPRWPAASARSCGPYGALHRIDLTSHAFWDCFERLAPEAGQNEILDQLWRRLLPA